MARIEQAALHHWHEESAARLVAFTQVADLVIAAERADHPLLDQVAKALAGNTAGNLTQQVALGVNVIGRDGAGLP